MKKQKSKTNMKKSGVKKALIAVASILIILFAAVLTFVLTRLDFIVKTAIEKYGTQAAGVPVRVESVKIRLREGSAAIRGLTIANPEGFNGSSAFSLGESKVGIDIRSLAQDVKIINEIIVSAPKIFFEINSANAVNLNIIRENLEKSSTRENSSRDKKQKKGPEPRLIIRHILFSGGSIEARIASLNDKTIQLKLPAVEMEHLGGKNGATPDELTRQIVGELCRRAVAEVEKKAAHLATEKAKDAVRSQIESGVGRLLK
jgi:hypothetical protein